MINKKIKENVILAFAYVQNFEDSKNSLKIVEEELRKKVATKNILSAK